MAYQGSKLAKVHPKLIQISYFIYNIALDFPYWKNQRQLLCNDINVTARCVAVYFMPDAGLFCYGNSECCTFCAFRCAANLNEIYESSNDYPLIKLRTYESV